LSFDDQGHSLQPFTDNHFTTAFFVRYNATTGQYTNYGIIPAENAQPAQIPAVLGNRILTFSNKSAIYQWCIDGTFINEVDLSSTDMAGLSYSSLLIDDNGNLLLGFPTSSSGIIGNGISYGSPTGGSSAVFALYHDPEFATPYVGVPEYGAHSSNLKIWPNPAIDILYVENDDKSIDYITIMDINGKILMRETVENYRTLINVSQLPAGTYLLESVGKDFISVGKIIKSNY
jgi:hypothetical protein